jgi:acyl carrier protein
MTQTEIERALLGFVVRELLDGSDEDFDAQTPILELGIIDSLSIVSLLAFLDERCGVSVPSEQVRPESFKDVASIALLASTLTSPTERPED